MKYAYANLTSSIVTSRLIGTKLAKISTQVNSVVKKPPTPR